MAKKLRVGILFGGRSGEHEVSLRSAASILKAIDRKKYEVIPIGITKQGQWLTAGNAQALLAGETGTADLTDAVAVIPPVPAVKPSRKKSKGIVTSAQPASPALDVVFPVLHGTFGEDGTIQGLFELADIAYVGSGVLGSSAGMDKDAMKRMFAASGLPMTPHVTVLRSEWKTDPKRVTRLIQKKLVYPLFVKPANLGSSVGISKVKSRADLAAAMDLAASFDRKLVIEEGVGGPGVKPRELEVAVLGNDNPEASVVGEIVPDREFYDYESKYDSSSTSEPVIPADITKQQAKQIREMAIAAFRACDCSGLARVDFLMEPSVDANGKKIKNPRIVLNEINTMPGFTSISMYPKLWDATGIPYKELISRLIELGLERQAEKRETSFSKDTL